MRYRTDEPHFTRVLEAIESLRPSSGSVIITGASSEARSTYSWQHEQGLTDALLFHAVTLSNSEATFSDGTSEHIVQLRNLDSIRRLLDLSQSAIYLDITGLPHHVWAPVLRAMRLRTDPCFAIYVEPGDYKFHPAPTDVTLFDLSERFSAAGPLPGFATLSSQRDKAEVFVPLLGFEGARLANMLDTVQPKREEIFPVIGVPGFRPEYPFYSYLGNRIQLLESRAWQNVRYASANCPFALYHLLAAIASETEARLRVAIIGTKPHALGAILYYLDHPSDTELLYDFPVRKPGRTSGVSRVCVYDLSLLPPYRPDRAAGSPAPG